MQLVQQKKRMKIENQDPIVISNRKLKRRHSILLPDTIRCIVCGPSNCGKTNVVVGLLLHPLGLKFENIYLYSKTPFQPKYTQLGKAVGSIKGMGYHVYSENVDIVTPKNAKENSIFIFDDVACDKQNTMREYFSMGRHSKVDSFYLCQTYSRIPKQLIRDNANMIILFRQDETNLRHVYNDHVNTDMPFEKFKEMCALSWEDGKHGFLVIDKDSDINEGRYRKGFDTYIRR